MEHPQAAGEEKYGAVTDNQLRVNLQLGGWVGPQHTTLILMKTNILQDITNGLELGRLLQME
jgi:hypothetical protein